MNGTAKRKSFSVSTYKTHCNDYDGICLRCGAIRWGDTEPDARDYPCESCGENKAYGFEEALLMGAITVRQ